MSRLRFVALSLASYFIASSALLVAQTPDVAPVGIPIGSTITTDGMDTVVLSNLGIHFNIPIRSKAGRRIPFSVSLNFDNQAYGNMPVQGGYIWTLVTGEHPLNGPIGTLHYTYNQFATCTYVDSNGNVQHLTYPRYSVTSYTDGQGTSHPFGSVGWGLPFTNFPPAHTFCNIPLSVAGMSWDGSGIYVTANGSSSTITLPNGTQVAPAMALSNGQIIAQTPVLTDANGNWITESWAAAGYPEIGSFTDTLGTVPITVENSAAFPSTLSFSYLNSSGSYVLRSASRLRHTHCKQPSGALQETTPPQQGTSSTLLRSPTAPLTSSPMNRQVLGALTSQVA